MIIREKKAAEPSVAQGRRLESTSWPVALIIMLGLDSVGQTVACDWVIHPRATAFSKGSVRKSYEWAYQYTLEDVIVVDVVTWRYPRRDPREVDSSRRPCATFGPVAFLSRMIMTIHKYEVTERLLAFP